MKKIAMLLSVLMIFCMLGTSTVFAAGTTDATIVLTPNTTDIKIGDTVTITVGVNGDTSGLGLFGTAKIQPKWDTEYFEYVSGEVVSSTFELGSATNLGETTTADGYVSMSQKVNAASGETPVAGNQTFGTIKLKALKAGSTNVTLNSGTSVYVAPVEGATVSNRVKVDSTTTVALTIKAASTDIVVEDETFDATNDLQTKDETVTSGDVKVNGETFATMGANGVIKTYFKKNATDSVLKAGTYGITVTIGGTAYKFPGKADVPAGSAWAIKLVIPNGQFKDGEPVGTFGTAEAY